MVADIRVGTVGLRSSPWAVAVLCPRHQSTALVKCQNTSYLLVALSLLNQLLFAWLKWTA
ncbi:hypothetical protein SERLA73DRAFT_178200 [Serpula lacrymans var. lacrymans S7.3]|uniref:Uncharacterized protein n=1 Tax=Serpula lacrymans var. lacrymans (strain S7.3) TaxID=936435 RepID=F8PQX5_SERL3|nr:hypothetical protein SERLA73DRAFT_178200 [Serpula lacrymans var. lacrymans S7.3]